MICNKHESSAGEPHCITNSSRSRNNFIKLGLKTKYKEVGCAEFLCHIRVCYTFSLLLGEEYWLFTSFDNYGSNNKRLWWQHSTEHAFSSKPYPNETPILSLTVSWWEWTLCIIRNCNTEKKRKTYRYPWNYVTSPKYKPATHRNITLC